MFDKDTVGQSAESSNEEKIRYAKWKAADIAKAFREGRKPTPGPAASEAPTTPTEPAPAAQTFPSGASGTPPPAFSRSKTPPPPLTDIPSPQQPEFFQTPVRGSALNHGSYLHPGGGRPDPHSPGSWSTTATPGTPGRFTVDDGESHTPQFASPTPSRPPRATVSEELEGRAEDEWDDVAAEASPAGSAFSKRAVRFTPSTLGRPSSAGPDTPAHAGDDPFDARVVVNSPPAGPTSLPDASAPQPGLPLGFVPAEITPHPEAPPLDGLPPGFVPSPRASAPPLPPASPVPSLPSPPRTHVQFSPAAPPPPVLYPHGAPPPPPPVVSPRAVAAAATVTNVPVVLTPALVTRAQKHCRFAISALDYEDAEQARKELRAALEILGG